ncbi:glucose 1-dehydrogenase [Colletotrichum spaethianum]|uniref:Glucose 1-dehydrogenase n=1 Tax=Colletotrichum spaethianum TaxID=700344 RepID=A0AA37PDA1_9PEZI|nr:glucose 1-dehydrogenase [Colletotrichum spaethianum]GKT50079.1 glucose 1-dehydrogenase [Colletotrichum spaethianum]
MPGTSPVVLILGAGPRVGLSVASVFASKGYKVAVAARSLKEADSTDNQLNIKSDFANPDEVVNAFAKVTKELGIPSVVIYNAGAATFSPPNDPFAIPLDAFKRDMTVNTTSVFVAAQQAVLGFAELPADAPRTFLFTGNILNVRPLPRFLESGAGKSASAHMMMAAASEYKEKGFKFYYVDERKEDGSAAFKIDGEAHAKLFWELAETKTQGPWLQTFVKGVGYKDFGPYRF